MSFLKRTAAVFSSVLALCSASAERAVVAPLDEVGRNVVFRYQGTLDLGSIQPAFTARRFLDVAITTPDIASFSVSSSASDYALYSAALSGPGSFGTSMVAVGSSSSTGGNFGFVRGGPSHNLVLDVSYQSGDFISGSANFTSTSLFDMGIDKGTYEYFLATGDKISFRVGTGTSAVPLPASSLLLIGGFAALGGLRMRSRRKH